MTPKERTDGEKLAFIEGYRKALKDLNLVLKEKDSQMSQAKTTVKEH